MNERALLEAIIANPEDDEPRLVYADLLESQGDPRGEFIQLQCKLARQPDPVLQARASELAMAHGRSWLASLMALKLGAQFGFERGFVTSMAAPFPGATTRAEAVLEGAPLLSKLELTIHGQVDRVELARPRSTLVLARAASLFIRGRHRGNTRNMRGPIADFSQLATVPFTRLTSLRLETLRPKPANLVGLLRSPHVQTLQTLILRLRMPVVETTQVLSAIPPVRVLDLGANEIAAAGIAALLDSSRAQLEALVLDQAGLTTPAVELLQRAELPALRTLSLRYHQVRESLLDPTTWKNAPNLEAIVV